MFLQKITGISVSPPTHSDIHLIDKVRRLNFVSFALAIKKATVVELSRFSIQLMITTNLNS